MSENEKISPENDNNSMQYSLWWELGNHFESQQEENRDLKAQLKTTVSHLALIAPFLFMSPNDPAKMVQMLLEKRDRDLGEEE